MFRHRGRSRTFLHNLKLASLLSFVAGIVNVCGLFAVQRLTTNITGHFAFFADEMAKKHFTLAWVYLLFILAFFFGAFCSNMLVEMMSRYKARLVNLVPVGIEIIILTIIAFLDPSIINSHPNTIAVLLLFAMGLQNALVTWLSNAVVRTTHLTGLFTDLGIELSQLFFYKKEEQQKKLTTSIKLRLSIISFFFLGGMMGGIGFLFSGIKTLLLAALTLAMALFYDSVKMSIVIMKRRFRSE